MLRENVFVSGDKKSAGAAGGIEDAIVRLRVETRHHEINDVSRRPELAVLGLDAHRLEQILKRVAEFLAVRVNESVHLIEEKREDAAVAELQERVPENVAEKRGQMLRFSDRFDAFARKDSSAHQRKPSAAVMRASDISPAGRRRTNACRQASRIPRRGRP